MEIPDTRQDLRMRDNGLVAGDPGLRFYAGALLQTPGRPADRDVVRISTTSRAT